MHALVAGLLLAVVSGSIPAWAIPGDPDLSFGSAGFVTSVFSIGAVIGTDAVLQPDGKVVVGGGGFFPGDGITVALARYDVAGSLDPSFSIDGFVADAIGRGPAEAVLLLNDGTLVAAGNRPSGLTGTDVRVTNVTSGGFLYVTGNAVTDLGGEGDYATALALQPDGKIVVAGFTVPDTSSAADIALLRYEVDGSRDLGFGAGGIVITDLGADERAQAVLVQPGGRIVVAGTTDAVGGGAFLLVGYQSDGSIDASFGTGGMVTTDFSPVADDLVALVRQPDGKLVAAGSAGLGSETNRVIALARYDSDGAVDAGFGSGGTAGVAGRFFKTGALVLEPDGKLVTASVGDPSVVVLTRFDDDGSLDTSFGAGGQASLNGFVLSSPTARALVRRPDGRLIVAGGAVSGTGGINRPAVGFALASVVAGTCGNGTLEAGEDCDDGNVADGDGCDAHCCTTDADGDGRCDANDPCTATVAVTAAKLRIREFKNQLTAQGTLMLPFPITPPLDPASNGARLVFSDALGTLLDVTLPAGMLPDVRPKTGWSVRSNSWTFSNRLGAPPGSITRLVVKASTRIPGKVTFRIQGKPLAGGGFQFDDFDRALPLDVVVMLDASTPGGLCAHMTFPGPPGPTCVTSLGNTTCQ